MDHQATFFCIAPILFVSSRWLMMLAGYQEQHYLFLLSRLAGQLINRSLLPTDTTGTMALTCCSPSSMAYLQVKHSEIVSCFSRYRQETWNFLPPGFRNHFQYKFQMKQKPGYFHLPIILCIFALEYKEWIFYYQNLWICTPLFCSHNQHYKESLSLCIETWLLDLGSGTWGSWGWTCIRSYSRDTQRNSKGFFSGKGVTIWFFAVCNVTAFHS